MTHARLFKGKSDTSLWQCIIPALKSKNMIVSWIKKEKVMRGHKHSCQSVDCLTCKRQDLKSARWAKEKQRTSDVQLIADWSCESFIVTEVNGISHWRWTSKGNILIGIIESALARTKQLNVYTQPQLIDIDLDCIASQITDVTDKNTAVIEIVGY